MPFKSISLVPLKIFLKTAFYFEKPYQIEEEVKQQGSPERECSFYRNN